MSIKTQIDPHFDHLTLPPPSQGTESPPGRLESSPSHLKTKLEDIYAPAKYRENMNAESVFCYWAIRQPRERAAARGKELRLSQFAGKAFFHQVFVIGKVCDHGIGEHM